MSVWDNAGEMLSRAQAARSQGDRELAYQMFARASELNPQDARAWQGRAETATSSDEALVSYAYATALDSSNQPLIRTLDAAVAQRVADADKGDVSLLLALGQELAEVGLTDRAQLLFQRVTELDHSSTDALVWLAGTTSDNAAQVDLLNRALATNPRDSRARAGLLAVKPMTSTAPTVPLSRPSVTAEPGATSLDVNGILAHAALTDDVEEREKLYQRVLQLDPDNVQARDGMSMLRVRRLRDTVRATESPVESPFQGLRAAQSSNQNRTRMVLIALIALVVILVVVGLILMNM